MTSTILTLLSFTIVFALHGTSAQPSPSTDCPSPTDFANTIIRAPLPDSPKLAIPPTFLAAHLLLYYTDLNTAISQASIASFCLDQCIAYRADPDAVPIAPDASSLPPSYISSKSGPCLSFTVDLGQPDLPGSNDTKLRWYCEGFDQYLAEDLSDFVPSEAEGSYMYGLGVNRGCGQGYRAF